MLFERRLREGVRDGPITLAFRRWKRAQVTVGGRYRMGYGLLAEVTSVEIVEDCTDEEARAAGYPDRAALTARLTRMGPWAVRTLRLIAERPGVRAADLAPAVGQDLARFKLNVRKLKALGLTISLETGYRLSPRGQAYLSSIT
ncbi:hypothetical protein EDD27_8482 [Nonomuraea polychroma]|uniref:ASCH domain-containing protein n=1 Tax=Nonomuraea polychroma TaxID=46176 RepID=A0A438MID9_9ACTN|nr:hypothetical protein [Nonomuraea polychroma]RVX45669.1 hypothetical protein EDD27_8482 [Nonomuraea polychroma]